MMLGEKTHDVDERASKRETTTISRGKQEGVTGECDAISKRWR
jgi:hypothetical protein